MIDMYTDVGCLPALAKEKEQDRMKISAMEHQLHQSESMYKMQMERTNERLKHYERALFDTRQVLFLFFHRLLSVLSSIFSPQSAVRSLR